MIDNAEAEVILVAASGFIYGPKSSSNLGDRAQLACTVERLRTAFPESRLVAVANSLNDRTDVADLEVSYDAIRYLISPIKIGFLEIPLPTSATRALRGMALIASCRRRSRGKNPLLLSDVGHSALREFEESSALFLSGAGTFNDLYLTSVGGFWGVLARCMSTLGKPVVASGQQIGPLQRLSRRALARFALRPIDLLGVRDPSSKTAARASGVSVSKVVLTGDDAWDLVPARSAVAHEILRRPHVPEPFVAVQVRFGVGFDESDCEGLANVLEELSSELDLPLLFVPCMTGSGSDDRYAAARVRAHFDVSSWAIEDELDAPTTKAILGRAVLGVGVANHFCVFAASMGTPVIGLHAVPYMEQKIKGIVELWPEIAVGLPKQAVLQPSALLTAARDLLHKQTERTEPAQPSIELHPDEPVRFLAERLRESPADSYSAAVARSESR